jgi:hypothetical protein
MQCTNPHYSPSDPPSGDHVLRFAIDLPKRISGRLNGGTTCSRSTIKEFFSELFLYLGREYSDWKTLAKHQDLLLSVLHNHEAKGLCSSTIPGRWQQRQTQSAC